MIDHLQRSSIFKAQGPWRPRVGLPHLEFHQVGLAENKQECCYCQVTSVVSDSVRPHRRQPTRLPCPWDSPGKNTGVGCHFLLQCMKVKSESEVDLPCPTLSDPMDGSPPGSSAHEIFQARVLEWGAMRLGPMTLSLHKSPFTWLLDRSRKWN